MDLPLSTRAEIAGKFGIQKKGPTHVDSNRIVSDGYVMQEVEAALTPENILFYLDGQGVSLFNDSDPLLIWTTMVDHIEGKLISDENKTVVEAVKSPDLSPDSTSQEKVVKRKPGRPKKVK